jgi:hypothetical protein
MLPMFCKRNVIVSISLPAIIVLLKKVPNKIGNLAFNNQLGKLPDD